MSQTLCGPALWIAQGIPVFGVYTGKRMTEGLFLQALWTRVIFNSGHRDRVYETINKKSDNTKNEHLDYGLTALVMS
jgi:hypothetical protein